MIIILLSIFTEGGYSATLEELRSLPYISWSGCKADARKSGVVKYDKEKSFDGYNLYTDCSEKAFLMDMGGRIVHTWRFPFPGYWEYASLLDSGQLIALAVNKYLARLNRDSGIIWVSEINTSHDIEVLPDGTFLVPVRRPFLYNGRRVIFDAIFHISEKGRKIGEWWTNKDLGRLKKLHLGHALDRKEDDGGEERKDKRSYDYYHLNTIQALPDTPLGKKDKRFQKGNWLICLRNVDLVCLLDKQTRDVVWNWGPGELDQPHMPTMLDNGNILIFDNGTHREYSRIIEIDPVSKEIVWEYKANPPEGFFSKWRGSNQRLANGNTLICESENGRVFEITANGEIVWEFFNPEIKDSRRKLIYRMLRVPKEKVEGWLSCLSE